MKTSALLITARCSIWIGSLSALLPIVTAPNSVLADRPVANKVVIDKPVVIETESDSGVFVEQTHRNNRWSKILVIPRNHSVYRVPDEKVAGWDTGKETDFPHEFHLSADKKWLFVTKKLFHRMNVGYLYRFDGVRFTQVRPDGLRFDDAALGFFARHIHTPFPSIESGARVIRFEKWTGDGTGLIFQFAMGYRWDGRQSHRVVGNYGLKSHHFTLLLHERPDE